MDSSDNENFRNSIENLKLFALSTHEKLKSLHSRDLFRNFSNNQFEILLEDLKNGKYDENKWGIQKRVEWHVLHSLKSNGSEQVYNDNDTKTSEKLSPSQVEENIDGNSHLLQKSDPSDKFSHRRPKKVVETRHKIISCKKQYEKLHNLNKMMNKSIVQTLPESTTYKKIKEKKSPRVSQTHPPYKSVHLEMVSIPHINILPLSKHSLPSVNIEPSVTTDELPRKDRNVHQHHKKRISNSSTNLQAVKNVSIDIPPLHKQKQATIHIPPSKISNKSINNNVNKVVYEFKHSDVSSEEDSYTLDNERNSASSRNDLRKTNLDLRKKKSNITKVFRISPRCNVDHQFADTYNKMGTNVNTTEFDRNRFIVRLEERLSSTLPSPPDIKFVETKSIPVTQKYSVQDKNVESIPSEDVSQPEVLNTSKISKIPQIVSIKSSTGTQTSFISGVDKFVQVSLNHDNDRKTMFDFKYDKRNTDQDENDNDSKRELSQNPSEKVSQSSSTSRRVSFDLDQESSSGKLVKKRDIDSKPDISSYTNVTKNTNFIINKNNICTNDKNLVDNTELHDQFTQTIDSSDKNLDDNLVQLNQATQTNDISYNIQSPVHYKDNIQQEIDGMELPSCGDNISEQISCSQENIVEQKSSPDHSSNVLVFDEEQSLYSHSFPSSSPENEVINQYENSLKSTSDDKSQISYDLDAKCEDSTEKEEKNLEISSNTNISELVSPEETILPSIEIGDVTISEGEIEFEASISDFQPCNRIAIKFSTKDLGVAMNKNESPEIADKETQTSSLRIAETSNLENTIPDSSFSEGIILPLENGSHVITKNKQSTGSEPCDETLENVSEGELIGHVTPILENKEKEILLIENRKLLQRLSGITGRFVCR